MPTCMPAAGTQHRHSVIVREESGGYTIIELLVVMVILAVLAGAAMPLVELNVRREKERELHRALWQIRSALDAYHAAYEQGKIANQPDRSGYPPTLTALVAGVPDTKKEKSVLYFLRQIPRDPFAPGEAKPDETWALRSYASPADKPSAGDDVFDVHSKADGTGTNGLPYKQW